MHRKAPPRLMRILVAIRSESSWVELARVLRGTGTPATRWPPSRRPPLPWRRRRSTSRWWTSGSIAAWPSADARLRARGVTPILALALSDHATERAAALDHGCDDCVGAPVDMVEIRPAFGLDPLHHGSAEQPDPTWAAEVRRSERVVYIDGQQVQLSRRELSLLEILISRRGRFVRTEWWRSCSAG